MLKITKYNRLNDEEKTKANVFISNINKEEDGNEDGILINKLLNENRNICTYMMFYNDIAIGTISYIKDDGYNHLISSEGKNIIWIGGFVIHREYRRKGFGKYLFYHILARVFNLNNEWLQVYNKSHLRPHIFNGYVDDIYLNVLKCNDGAISLYKSFGFNKCNQDENVYIMNFSFDKEEVNKECSSLTMKNKLDEIYKTLFV